MKKVLVKDWPNLDEFSKQFYVKDWSFGIHERPRFDRYTLSGKKWKYKSFYLNDEDLIEIEIPFEKFEEIQHNI